MNYYRRYIGDFQRDTGHLSLAEIGAYDRLLDHYYATERALPVELDLLCRIARAVSRDEQAAIKAVAEAFFPVVDGLRHNPRADREIGIAQSTIEKQREAGVNAAVKRWGSDRSTHKSQIQPPTTIHQPPSTQPPEPTPNRHGKPTAGRSRDAASEYPPAFEATWALYPKRQGDNPKRRAFHAYRARLKDGHAAEQLHEGVERYAAFVRSRGQEHTEFVKQAATFFGPDKAFMEPWTVNGRVDPLEVRNAAATAGWLPPEMRNAGH